MTSDLSGSYGPADHCSKLRALIRRTNLNHPEQVNAEMYLDSFIQEHRCGSRVKGFFAQSQSERINFEILCFFKRKKK